MTWFRHHVRTGSQPIDYSTDAHTSQRKLEAVLIHWSAAPTTSEDIVVTLNSALGSDYDTVIYRLDPSTDSTVDVLLTEIELPLFRGDAIDVDYANSDGRTVTVQIMYS